MFNKAKFKGKVMEAGETMKAVSDYLGIDSSTLYRKITGESDFTRTEIKKVAAFLKLSTQEVDSIFFDNELT